MIEVNVDRFDTDEGLLILSLKGAAVEASWENLRKGLIVEARVTKTNKGGLDVEVDGIRGFLPIGQIDINRVEDAAIYVNQKLRVVVTEANQREKNLVVSRRELLERERAEQREKTWAALEEGQVRHGVDPLGQGLRGLRRHRRRRRPAPRRRDELDRASPTRRRWSRSARRSRSRSSRSTAQTSKVSLGLKQLTPSPWDRVEEKYARGMTVKGKVTRLMDFGAFVELEPGIEGLIHISELSPNRVRRVADIVKPEPGGRGPHPQDRARGQEDRRCRSAPCRPPPRPRPRRRTTTRPPRPSPSGRSRSRGASATATRTRSSPS